MLAKNRIAVDDHGSELKTPEVSTLKSNAPMAEERWSRRGEQARRKAEQQQRTKKNDTKTSQGDVNQPFST
jgi:hypothetical protein